MLKWVSIFFFILFAVTVTFLCTSDVFKTKQSYEMSGNIIPSYVKAKDVYEINNYLNQYAFKLTRQNFFKYFLADVNKSCDLCETSLKCSLDQCPIGEEDLQRNSTSYKVFISDPRLLSNFTMLTQLRNIEENPAFNKQSAQKSNWIKDENQNKDSLIYKVSKIPECFTGHNETNIWNEIYNGNLAQMKFPTPGAHDQFLYKLISGLHSSISLHISNYYDNDFESSMTSRKFDRFSSYKNHTVFYERVGKYPERVKNLFYLYLFVIHAFDNLYPYLPEYVYDSANSTSNKYIHKQMRKVSHFIDLLPDPEKIDSNLFDSISKSDFVNIVKPRFDNITQLLDCIQCSTCKFNGKIQMTGLATVLKILFSDSNHIEITDNEMIGLVHLLHRVTNAVKWYKEYRNTEVRYRVFSIFTFCILILIAIIMLAIGFWLLCGEHYKLPEDKMPLKRDTENSS